jgi:hypothetical protein
VPSQQGERAARRRGDNDDVFLADGPPNDGAAIAAVNDLVLVPLTPTGIGTD